MSEKKKLLEYLTNFNPKETLLNIWGLEETFADPNEREILLTIFTKEQLEVIHAIVFSTKQAIDFHDSFESSHEKLRTKMTKNEARLRNHRHEMSKNYSGKAEY